MNPPDALVGPQQWQLAPRTAGPLDRRPLEGVMLDAIVTVAATDWSAALGGLASELEAGKLLFFRRCASRWTATKPRSCAPTCARPQVPQHQPEA